MENNKEKTGIIRGIVYLLAFIIAFELGMLAIQVPVRNAFFWITVGALVLMNTYLVLLCLKLLREMKEK